MSNWLIIRPQSWCFHGSNAPAAAVYKDKVIVYGDPVDYDPVIETDNLEFGDWKTNFAILNIKGQIQDPDLIVNDDGKVYFHEESSNAFPIRMVKVDP